MICEDECGRLCQMQLDEDKELTAVFAEGP